MQCRISEGSENSIKLYNNFLELELNDFGLLFKDYEEIIFEMLKDDHLIKYIMSSNDLVDDVFDCVVGKISDYELTQKLIDANIPLYSLIISVVDTNRRRYEAFKKLEECENVVINCDINNIDKVLKLASKFKFDFIIECNSISLMDYKKILEKYDLDKLEDIGFKISYQECNFPISPKALYDVSKLVSDDIKIVKNSNLSQLEQIVYIYDMVKKRCYSSSDNDIRDGRDLDRVLSSEYIVCTGYSNLFNAYLKCLGVPAMSLISISRNHQRSLVYLNDFKYNIKGVYAFDPTWDRLKDNNSNYINNYNYFCMPLSISNISAPDDMYSVVKINFDELLKLDENISSIDASVEHSINLRILFNFVGLSNYDEFMDSINLYPFLDRKQKEELRLIYNDFQSKFLVSDIDNDILHYAILNARKVQFREGIINSSDALLISDALETRRFHNLLTFIRNAEKKKIRKKDNNN